MSERSAPRRRKRQGPAPTSLVVRLDEADLARIVSEVTAVLRRERVIDDIARSVRDQLRELADESEATGTPADGS